LIDNKILSPVVAFLRSYDDFAVLVCPDHPTPLCIKTHSSDPVPYLIYSSRGELDGVPAFTEEIAQSTDNFISEGFTMMDYFLTK